MALLGRPDLSERCAVPIAFNGKPVMSL